MYGKGRALIVAICLVFIAGTWSSVAAHCDTLDGPVVQDARKALAVRDVTPVLKWVQKKDEKAVKNAFKSALAAQGQIQQDEQEKEFFETLVRIHRAGEGAPYTGIKPAGQVEPVIAEADRALVDNTAVPLVDMVTRTVSEGIRSRYEKVAEARRHMDESVEKGRQYVAAYVEYTHYLERLQQAAEGHPPAREHGGHKTKPGSAHKH